MKYHGGLLLNAFFALNLIFKCSYAATTQEDVAFELPPDDRTSLDNWYTIDGGEEIQIPVANDLSLPKCLSLRHSDGECDHIRSLYKNPERRQKMQLENIVFMMFIHNDESVDKLLKAHFDTWIKRLGPQTDFIFVTDEDDPRSFEETLPDADKARCNLSIYKSPAKKEGSRLRYKVADSFKYVFKQYQSDNTKEYFIKIDTDTYVLPVALMDLIRKIDQATNPQPSLFGRQRCSPPDFCYAAGPLYGMNKLGLNAVANYLSEHEEIFDEKHPKKNGTGNLMDVSIQKIHKNINYFNLLLYKLYHLFIA